ncbi:serine hydrolase domain-containing protein [Calditrichota bacterium]
MKTIVALLFLIYLTNSCAPENSIKKFQNSIEKQIDSIRTEYNIPAVSYGVVRNDSVMVQNAIGFRDINTKEKVQTGDLFHIGSNTKAFTSFLAAKLVEQGLITWDTKLFDLYPELKNECKPDYFNITLLELLSHRARLIKFMDDSETYPIIDYEKNIEGDLSIAEKRYHFIKQVLKYEPIAWHDHPDDRYSNAGFIAAALMLEKAVGKTWEKLIMEVSAALNLGIQIGWPDDNNPNQPKGHINPKTWLLDIDKELIPLPGVLKKYHYFNQYISLCNPSGNLSISLRGFLKYLRLIIEGLNGKDNYLKSESYKQIFNSYTDYSCGWMNEIYFVPCFHHRGSAGTFNSIAIIVPDKNVGIVIMINTHDGTGINHIAKILINKYSK